jgi:hypothetical protein
MSGPSKLGIRAGGGAIIGQAVTQGAVSMIQHVLRHFITTTRPVRQRVVIPVDRFRPQAGPYSRNVPRHKCGRA